MKTASAHELKQELQSAPPARLLELCLRLARFKKENKELLTYLLFEAHDEEAYIKSVKGLIDESFANLPDAGLYLLKKSLRKILRLTNKYIRYTGSRQVEVELLIHFCRQLKGSGIDIAKFAVVLNLYQQQLKKIGLAIDSLHEDLQYDYRMETEGLKPKNKEGDPFS